MLGISIRFCSFEVAKDKVWHILEVHPNSPADLAGLRSFSDYIIGSDSILHENEDLFNLIENHDGVSLKLYVYNVEDDSCREVSLTPNSRWGGEGLVGCGIGYGYLHRIPVRANLQPQTTNELLPASNLFAQSANDTPIVNLVESTANLTLDSNQIQQEQQQIHQTPVNSEPVQPVTTVYSNVPPPTAIPQFYNVSNTNMDIVQPVPVYPTQSYPNYNYQQPPITSQVPVFTNFSQSDLNTNVINIPTAQVQPTPPTVAALQQPQPPPPVAAFQQPQLPPPVTHFQQQQQQPLIFDPTIAARSAQQLLSANNPTE